MQRNLSMNSKKQDFYKQKIKAFLHDPPEKPLILGLGKGHEVTSEKYIKRLLGNDEPFDKDEWKFADHVASAADRTSFPMDYKSFRVDFRKNPILTHPTSGAKFDLGNFVTIDPKLIEVGLNTKLDMIKEASGNDYKKMFLYLWRTLSNSDDEVDNNQKIGKLWDYLPADTRIPDHSVSDHSRIVSAFAGAGIKEKSINASLIQFSIGPVQEFIAAARKTQDLWAGSYLLSWLAWQGMKVFCEEIGPDSIIFPDLKGQPLVDFWLKSEQGLSDLHINPDDLTAPTLPNQFFAIVPSDKVDELCDLATIEIKNSLLNVGSFVFNEIKDLIPNEALFKNWETQLSDFVQCYWVSFDLPDWKSGDKNLNDEFKKKYNDLFLVDEKKSVGKKQEYRDDIFNAYDIGGFNPNIGTFYGRFYEIVDKSLGARKAIRDFNQIEESGYRCSLIPGLAALIPPEKNPNPSQYREFWSDLYKGFQKSKYSHLLGKNERLSPLAITKRFFPTYLRKVEFKNIDFNNLSTFNSTHSLAVADFKYQLLTLIKDLDKDSSSNNYNKIVDALDKFFQLANKSLELLNLNQERDLNKVHWLAKDISIDGTINLINFSKLPGELFQLSYYDNYKDDLKIIDSGNGLSNKEVETIFKSTQKALRNLINCSGLNEPSKYYAIIYLDGDNIGKWLSGDNAPEFWKVLHPDAIDDLLDGIINHLDDKDDELAKKYRGWSKIIDIKSLNEKTIKSKKRPQAPTQHMAISRALNNFSLKLVKKIVDEEFLGQLIYAGGDDVIAMVSLHDALPCAEKLRAAFSGHLKSDKDKTIHDLEITLGEDESKGFLAYKNRKEIEIVTTLGHNATASCGIAIAHYMYPLKQAMAEARKAEKFAKKDLGRDAFAVNVVKRSGEVFITGSKWVVDLEKQNINIRLSQLLKDISLVFKNRKLSPKFIFEIEDSLNVFEALDKNAVISEIKRIYNQHNDGFYNYEMTKKGVALNEHERKKVTDDINNFFDNTIFPLFDNCDKLNSAFGNNGKQSKSENKHIVWPNLRNALKLIDMAYYIGKGDGR